MYSMITRLLFLNLDHILGLHNFAAIKIPPNLEQTHQRNFIKKKKKKKKPLKKRLIKDSISVTLMLAYVYIRTYMLYSKPAQTIKKKTIGNSLHKDKRAASACGIVEP